MANEEWNAESALRREERQQKEAKEKTELMLKNIQRAEEQKTFLLAKANEFVQAEKVRISANTNHVFLLFNNSFLFSGKSQILYHRSKHRPSN